MATKKPMSEPKPTPKPTLIEVHFIKSIHLYDSCVKGEAKEVKTRLFSGAHPPVIIDDPEGRLVTFVVKTTNHGTVGHRVPYENISRLVYQMSDGQEPAA